MRYEKNAFSGLFGLQVVRMNHRRRADDRTEKNSCLDFVPVLAGGGGLGEVQDEKGVFGQVREKTLERRPIPDSDVLAALEPDKHTGGTIENPVHQQKRRGDGGEHGERQGGLSEDSTEKIDENSQRIPSRFLLDSQSVHNGRKRLAPLFSYSSIDKDLRGRGTRIYSPSRRTSRECFGDRQDRVKRNVTNVTGRIPSNGPILFYAVFFILLFFKQHGRRYRIRRNGNRIQIPEVGFRGVRIRGEVRQGMNPILPDVFETRRNEGFEPRGRDETARTFQGRRIVQGREGHFRGQADLPDRKQRGFHPEIRMNQHRISQEKWQPYFYGRR